MPDIACKAILRFTSLRFFSFFCWRFAELAWAFTFFKSFYVPNPLSPAPGVRHFSPPRDFWARSSRGEGAGGLCSPKTTLPWEFPVAISHGRAPSSGWKPAACPPGARDASVEGNAWLPPAPGWEAAALPGLPLLRSRRREPGCWIQSLRRVLHFHKRAATRRGRDCCRRGRPRLDRKSVV